MANVNINCESKVLITSALLLSLLTANAQDWVNLKRYQNENSTLIEPDKGENRVVFMVNSITQFWVEKNSVFLNKTHMSDEESVVKQHLKC